MKTNLYTGKYRMKKDDFRQLRKNFTIFRCHIPILQRVGYISLFAFYHFKFFSLLPYLICWCQDFISFFHFPEAFSSSLKKHLFVQSEMYLRLRWNFLVFCVKCTYVLRCTENSCQFENLFLTKLTGWRAGRHMPV